MCLVWPSQVQEGPLWKAVLVSWLIALLEFCFQLPANRAGYGQFTAAQLKIIQDVIMLVVFSIVSLGEELCWNYLASFVCILGAVYFAFR